MTTHPPKKPAENAEDLILDGIINGRYPVGSALPSERELAIELKVTRPTLREVLQRLARNGWLEIRHGKPTMVRNFMEDGNLSILSSLADRKEGFSAGLLTQILQTRLLLAPEYTRVAITNASEEVQKSIQKIFEGSDDPAELAHLDLQLQKALARLSGNMIHLLMLNDLENLYIKAMEIFYQDEETRKQARVYFKMVYKAARAGEPDAAEAITRRVMQESLIAWESKIEKPAGMRS